MPQARAPRARHSRILTVIPIVAAAAALVLTMAPQSSAGTPPVPPAGSTHDLGTAGWTDSPIYQGNWAAPDAVDTYVTSDHRLGVVDHSYGNFSVTVYDPATGRRAAAPRSFDTTEWPLWGGFYDGPDGYFYVLVGRDNDDEVDSRTVMAVRRYSPSWNLVGTAYIKGGASQGIKGIYVPFDAGAADMTLVGHRLVIHTSRLFYEIDGVHHQGDFTFEVDTRSMRARPFSQVSARTPDGYAASDASYSSHSFNQFVTMDGHDLVFIDHGDAYPRAIQMSVMADYPRQRMLTSHDLLTFGGATGDNYTGAAVTDVASGPRGILVLGNSIRHPQATPQEQLGPHDAFVIAADPATGRHRLQWLSEIPSSQQDGRALGPRAVEVAPDRFAVLFGVESGQSDDASQRLEYVLIDSAGIVHAHRTFFGVRFTGSNAPVLIGDTVYWLSMNVDGDQRDAYVNALDVSRPAAPALLASWCPPSPFPDVADSNPHCRNIGWLKLTGITKPADGKYHPGNTVTRGSMTAFLFRLTHPGKVSPACTARPFPDVSTSNIFCGYIAWAARTGVAKGYPDGTFGPDRPVTRGAMSAFLQRVADDHPAPACTAAPYRDVSAHSTFCRTITWAKKNGITFGVGDGTRYGTAEPVTRQAMASFLHRIDDYLG